MLKNRVHCRCDVLLVCVLSLLQVTRDVPEGGLVLGLPVQLGLSVATFQGGGWPWLMGLHGGAWPDVQA